MLYGGSEFLYGGCNCLAGGNRFLYGGIAVGTNSRTGIAIKAVWNSPSFPSGPGGAKQMVAFETNSLGRVWKPTAIVSRVRAYVAVLGRPYNKV